jgi:hypothetical protein
MKYIMRTTQITVLPEGEPTFSEMATHIEIVDEAAGEFLEISQNEGKCLKIDPEEWPKIRDAIDLMMGFIDENKEKLAKT